MAFNRAPQGDPHGITRIKSVGSPFEVANNTSRIPQTLNYVDCYPVREEQFGENPIYQVSAREAFKTLSSFDLSTIVVQGAGNVTSNYLIPSGTAPTTLSGYTVVQVGNIVTTNDDISGTNLVVNIQMSNTTPAFQPGGVSANFASCVVTINLGIAGTLGQTVLPTPVYIYFAASLFLGLSVAGNFNVNPASGQPTSSIDPYYILLPSPPTYTLTVSGNPSTYNIYNALTAALTAPPAIAYAVIVQVPLGQTVGSMSTDSKWLLGTTITVINAGTILGSPGVPNDTITVYRPSSIQANTGGNGGPAIYQSWPLTVVNTGTIGGGGGAGAFGACGITPPGGNVAYGGGAGGPGAGYPSGPGIASYNSNVYGSPNTNGGNSAAGTNTTGGNGGLGATGGGGTSSIGNGGAIGVAGTNGLGTPYAGYGGSGGGGLGAAGGGLGFLTYSGLKWALTGGLPGNAIQCNGFSINIPLGSYTGGSAYGTIYGVIG